MTIPTTPRELFEQCRDMDASVNERLGIYTEGLRKLDAAYSRAADELIARLRASGAGATAPRPGEPMPAFVLPDERARLVSLDALLQNGPAAITFHRGHWCPYCRINIHALARVQENIAAEGARIVAVMPERQQFAQAFKAEAEVNYPVLIDVDSGYGMSLNLVFWIGSEMEQLLAGYGRDVPTYQGNDSWMFPLPATFVVGRDGIIKARFVDPDYRHRMAIEELLHAVKSAAD